LVREAELAREVLSYLEQQSSQALEIIRRPHPQAVSLPVDELLKLPLALQRTVVRLALREARGDLRGITARHVTDILDLCEPGRSGRRISLPRESMVSREFACLLFFITKPKPIRAYCHELPLPGRCTVTEAGIQVTATIRDRVEMGAKGMELQDSTSAILDRKSLPEILTVRSRLPGDRYAGGHRRKVKRMLIDAKVPLPARSELPMVVADKDVIWIPGFKPAKPYQAQAGSDSTVMLEISEIK